MALAYGITALVALCMVVACIFADKKRDVWLVLVFVSVAICDVGYYMLSISKSLDDALNSNRIAYLGSVFLPFFMLMMILRFCGMKRGKRLIIPLVVFGIIMLGITTSPGILPIYYSTVDIAFLDGGTKLIREYGPFHALYYACVDAECSLNLTALRSDEISVSMSDENCYTLSFNLGGGDGE